jgi:hypothetical protein
MKERKMNEWMKQYLELGVHLLNYLVPLPPLSHNKSHKTFTYMHKHYLYTLAHKKILRNELTLIFCPSYWKWKVWPLCILAMAPSKVLYSNFLRWKTIIWITNPSSMTYELHELYIIEPPYAFKNYFTIHPRFLPFLGRNQFAFSPPTPQFPSHINKSWMH